MAFYQSEPLTVVIEVVKDPDYDDLEVNLLSVKPEITDCPYHNEEFAKKLEEMPPVEDDFGRIIENTGVMCNACWFREDFSNYGSEDWLKSNEITPLNSCFIILKGRMTSETSWSDWGTEHDSYFQVEEVCLSKVFRDHLD